MQSLFCERERERESEREGGGGGEGGTTESTHHTHISFYAVRSRHVLSLFKKITGILRKNRPDGTFGIGTLHTYLGKR